ncbi:hypothetical protein GBA52_022062 [Prunus armeniaca]|nr:hypothetical protein GBA52_022062 [Prunus armeniaca]
MDPLCSILYRASERRDTWETTKPLVYKHQSYTVTRNRKGGGGGPHRYEWTPRVLLTLKFRVDSNQQLRFIQHSPLSSPPSSISKTRDCKSRHALRF